MAGKAPAKTSAAPARSSAPNKNQTAAERSAAAEALSGRICGKCGKPIKLKDLVNVRTLNFAAGGKSMMSYHRGCYGQS